MRWTKHFILIFGLANIIVICYLSDLGSYLQNSSKRYLTTNFSASKQRKDAAISKANLYLNKYSKPSDSKQIDNLTVSSKLSLDELSKLQNYINTSEKSDSQPAETDDVKNVSFYIAPYNMNFGRMGNKMFRYASLLGIAHAHGRRLVVDPDCKLQYIFKLQHVVVNEEMSGWPIIEEKNPLSFDENLMNLPLKDFRIDGFLQSYKYFESIADQVRHEFIFRDPIVRNADAVLNDLHSIYRDSLFVGVHVRRGDFVSKKKQKMGYDAPQKSYFIRAFDWMKSKFPERNITFLIASDDFTWCDNNLVSKDMLNLPEASPSVHMAILSKCHHVIITGGTFGWWTAWLAGGYTIYYTGFMPNGSFLGNLLVTKDYYPGLWVGFGN